MLYIVNSLVYTLCIIVVLPTLLTPLSCRRPVLSVYSVLNLGLSIYPNERDGE